MADEPKRKHVIILGAGASGSSGYPMADKLRLLMSSESTLREELYKQGKFAKEYEDQVIAASMGGGLKDIIELFRHGGFASVDEFSWLARNRYQSQIQGLKRILRLALSLHDPELTFHKSDYYSFIQRLFQKSLFSLRDDIAILTFNYDPYLPYLLNKAHSIRCHAARREPTLNEAQAITSGFAHFAFGALESVNNLCVLQLHGTIAWPEIKLGEQKICTADLYGKSVGERIKKLCFSDAATSEPPILFPWEIMKDDGTFLESNDFCLTEAPGDPLARQKLHQLFISIWKRAQTEITAAKKISFVGLSMHEFLNPAFKFLFKEKQNDQTRITVANMELANYPGNKATTNRASPAAKVGDLLHKVWHKRIDPSGGMGYFPELHETFEQFIKYEMD